MHRSRAAPLAFGYESDVQVGCGSRLQGQTHEFASTLDTGPVVELVDHQEPGCLSNTRTENTSPFALSRIDVNSMPLGEAIRIKRPVALRVSLPLASLSWSIWVMIST